LVECPIPANGSIGNGRGDATKSSSRRRVDAEDRPGAPCNPDAVRQRADDDLQFGRQADVLRQLQPRAGDRIVHDRAGDDVAAVARVELHGVAAADVSTRRFAAFVELHSVLVAAHGSRPGSRPAI